MPSKEKVGFAQLRVGVLGLVALFFIALLIFLLTGNTNWFEKEIPLHAYVSDAAGLNAGDPVRINGIQAGTVKNVALSGETNPQKVIKIDFVVDEQMLRQIPDDSIAAIGSDNLLGSTKFFQISKGRSSEPIQAGATMKTANTQEFQQLVQQGFGVLDSAQAILQKIQDIVSQIEVGKGTIGKLLVDESLFNSLQATVNQLQLLSTTLNSRTGTIGHLINDDTLYKQAETIVARLDTMTQALEQGQGSAGLFLKDPKLYHDLENSVDQLNTMLTNLNQGKGTAGQLLKDDKIAKQFSATLDKLNVTIDKVNSGQGTVGELLVNPQLYDAATGTTREMHELLKDFRANPKKFLSIKLHIF
ncbi:MAG: MCE family protein [Acidobacteriaceae bacterium]|nr:MCE family protein [Acidobacteriaceae bacterium]MBV9294368.1 MCE family protein [Acidobacteriaceae bacterium]MBV9767734.1 MCE family protein [Acidobacteriaceae bacterium]